ncbi:hypothetical protein M0R45_017678 [Rubus argutus]|uniref:Uncharacterized protein n=1 Tax=Rubus argutus TaxID=59490 RepID=A0AAW1XYB1_RUBAR
MTKDSNSSALVRLNVGGKEFCTYMDALTQLEPNSMLAAMFSERHTLCQGIDVCFSNAFLSDSYFDNADAEGANFNNANLGSSVFTGAILKGASAVGAVHEYLTNFGGASLSSAARVDGCTECVAGRWRYCTECMGASMQAEF